jgi:cysteine-rich repeat protein
VPQIDPFPSIPIVQSSGIRRSRGDLPMTSPTSTLRRFITVLAAIPLFAGVLPPAVASAATRLFVVVNEDASIWEINPTTGVQIATIPLVPPSFAVRPGLAFNGTEVFYTDENTAFIQVYDANAHVLLRQLPKPDPGTETGSGLGASATEVYAVSLDGKITRLDPNNGTVLGSFSIPGAEHALTFAGSRGTLFVSVNDSSTIKELDLSGNVVNTIIGPDIFRGLGFSSSSNVLFGVRAGQLWAINPNNGALLPGYPVEVIDPANGLRVPKTGAAAADEPLLVSCGDGEVNAQNETCDPPGSEQTNGALCRQNCTYCGDGVPDTGEQCDDGNTVDTDDCRNSCELPRCGDGKLDADEECDDGNDIDGDGCSSECDVEPFCGDGIVQPELGEQCEPPNTPGCDANCHAAEICTDFVDNDGDGQIDCIDPDCECGPIGRDPGAIRFAATPGTDNFTVHGSFVPGTQISPATENIGFLLSNKNGKVFEVHAGLGSVRQLGRNLFRFRDQNAVRTRHGLARVDVRYYPKRNNYTFVVKAYGDLTLATEAEMTLEFVLGDDPFVNTSTWAKTPKGWLLRLPGE